MPYTKDRIIGKVTSVETYRVSVEIYPEAQGFVQAYPTGVYEVARINHYVLLPILGQKIVAVVTHVFRKEEIVASKSTESLYEVKPRQELKASMVGYIDSDEFKQGIRQFPTLFNDVLFPTEGELDIIFRGRADTKSLISLGTSTVYPKYQVQIDADMLFAKHCAIIGNTGSGKSHTIARIIEAIKDRDVKNATIIILDVNGEYSSLPDAGHAIHEDLVWKDDPKIRIPYWFMDTAEFSTLFEASEKTQLPVLTTALQLARNAHKNINKFSSTTVIGLSVYMHKLHALATATEAPAYQRQKIKQNVNGLKKFVTDLDNAFKKVKGKTKEEKEALKTLQKYISDLEAQIATDQSQDHNVEPQLTEIIVKYYDPLSQTITVLSSTKLAEIDADAPKYFDIQRLLTEYFPSAVNYIGGRSLREHIAGLEMRIQKHLMDKRYQFHTNNKDVKDSLFKFVAYLLGGRWKDASSIDADNKERIICIDLSSLSDEILFSVTSMIGRMVLELKKKMGPIKINPETKKVESNNDTPIVMVLEEAHNYLPEHTDSIHAMTSRHVYERIAKEGRKFGLGLIISSQRPSELSKTLLSQCNSYIVHRIQNPEDKKYFESIVSPATRDLLDQLPILAPGHALIFGACLEVPAIVEVRMPQEGKRPHSDNPPMLDLWQNKIDWDKINRLCKEWQKENDKKKNGK